MPHNRVKAKLSTFIGITLLSCIVGFTFLMNFSEKDTEQKIEDIQRNRNFRPFKKEDLSSFWKLENLQTDSTIVREGKTYIQIYKTIKQVNTRFKEKYLTFDTLEDGSGVVYFRESNSEDSLLDKSIYYGTLVFKNTFDVRKNVVVFENIEVDSLNATYTDFSKLMEIGTIFLDHQITDITVSQLGKGSSTWIELKDGRGVILLKKDVEITDAVLEMLFGKGEYLNDSTRIIYPYSI